MDPYYKPSNKFSPLGLPLFLVGGGLTATVLAFIYIYAVWYIRFAYVNVVLTLGFGAILGMVLGAITSAGKIRSPFLAFWMGTLVGVYATLVQWALYLTLLFNTDPDKSTSRTSSFSLETMTSLLLHP